MGLLDVSVAVMGSISVILGMTCLYLLRRFPSETSHSTRSGREAKEDRQRTLSQIRSEDARFTCVNPNCVGYDKWYRPTTKHWIYYWRDDISPLCMDCEQFLSFVGDAVELES